MNENIKIITAYMNRQSRYVITKSKANMCVVKDEIISYKIDTNNYTCQCSHSQNTLCPHVIFLLINIFGRDPYVLKFFHRFKYNMYNIKTNIELRAHIITNYLSDDCGICTLKMNCEHDLHECKTCLKYCHMQCLTKWISKIKNTKCDKTCIYCHTEPLIIIT